MDKNQIQVLREAAPYIDSFRGKRFVLVLPHLNLFTTHFNSIVKDIILLKKLGMELVLIVNSTQIIRMNQAIDDDELSMIKKEIETNKAELIREFRNEGSKLRFLTILSTRFGVFDGTDTNRLGQLTAIGSDEIYQSLSQSSLFAISPIAKDNSDKNLLIHPLNLAADFASLIKADKLIIFTNQLKNIPGSYHLDEFDSDFSILLKRHNLDVLFQDFLQYQDLSAINRTHFIEQNSESLLGEIFSVNGSGVLINTDYYEKIRPAKIQDCFFIEKLIEKNLKKQAMIDRRYLIEELISQYHVIDRDGFIIGSGAIHLFDEDCSFAEIYGFSIHKDYQGQGRATALIEYLEKKIIELGSKHVMIKTTRAESWFVQKGYQTKNLNDLPKWIAKNYNPNRQSKILIKSL